MKQGFIGSDALPVSRHPDLAVVIVPMAPAAAFIFHLVIQFVPLGLPLDGLEKALLVGFTAVSDFQDFFEVSRDPDVVSAMGPRRARWHIAAVRSGARLDDHSSRAIRSYGHANGSDLGPDGNRGLRFIRQQEGQGNQNQAGQGRDDHELVQCVQFVQFGFHGVFLSLSTCQYPCIAGKMPGGVGFRAHDSIKRIFSIGYINFEILQRLENRT